MTQTDSNYVAIWNDFQSGQIIVLERDTSGNLQRVRYNPPYYFYVPNPSGTYESIFGDKLLRLEFDSRDEYEQAKRHHPIKFESDISPVKRVLMDSYYNKPAPNVHFALLDIEVNYSSATGGFSSPSNPYAEINAVTVYQSWTKKYLTAVIPPDGWTGSKEHIYEIFDKLAAAGKVNSDRPEIFICESEYQLLTHMLGWIQNSDIISGWNSEFYDLPYICERLLRCGGEKMLSKIDHLGVRNPRKEVAQRFGSEEIVYRLTARSHLDYMDLFKKFASGGRTSYSLGNILEEEVGLGKLDYDGTLEQLYKGTHIIGDPSMTWAESDDAECLSQITEKMAHVKAELKARTINKTACAELADFSTDELHSVYDQLDKEKINTSFALFTIYNWRDVQGLEQLDTKFKFIALANQMCHENTVMFADVLGTVNYVETGITNHAHYKLNKIVPDKFVREGDKAEGAIVMTPKIGLHEWVGAVDINSLYPNVIRSLNISPEKIIGQFKDGENAWHDIYKTKSNKIFSMHMECGDNISLPASEWAEVLSSNKWAISAFGTVFDQTGQGVIPDILAFWYAERKRLQAEKKKWQTQLNHLKKTLGKTA